MGSKTFRAADDIVFAEENDCLGMRIDSKAAGNQLMRVGHYANSML